MVRRLVLFLLALGVMAAPAPALAASAAASSEEDLSVRVTGNFSPNGDGRRDEAIVRYVLPESGSVSVVVSSVIRATKEIQRIVPLGTQSAGRHVWRWDGRGAQGARLRQDKYEVSVKVTTADGTVLEASRPTRIDRFLSPMSAQVLPRYTWALPDDNVHSVFPRTSVVRDSVALRPILREKLRRAELIIKDSSGRTVLRRDVSDSEDSGGFSFPDNGPHPHDIAWTARPHGKPLPRGRYYAFIRAEDPAGNRARPIRLRLWVSGDALEWRDETTVVTPSGSARGDCFLTTANGCGETPYDCGTVAPSAIYAGGLSYRSRECSTVAPRNNASSLHYLAVPESTGVRGVEAARVAFTGRPTTEGETDAGTLALSGESFESFATVVSSTGGVTDWLNCPTICRGFHDSSHDLTIEPGVVWSFHTKGTDSVDVASFTVTVRYLAVAK